jgi:parvulin-like peptidyl-prolyl isomerase
VVQIVAGPSRNAALPLSPLKTGGLFARLLKKLRAPWPPPRVGRRGLLSLVIPVLLFFAGDTPSAENTKASLATLGNKPNWEVDFQCFLINLYLPENVEEINRKTLERQKSLEEYLDLTAMAAKARHEGIDKERRFNKALELMEVKILSYLVTERYRERILRYARVSPEEVRVYYEQHKNEFAQEPRFTAHHLLVYLKGNPAFPEKGLGEVKARTKANTALAELRAGKSWDEVVKNYSDEITRSNNGGFIRDGRFEYFAPEVQRAIRTQELRKPGEVVKSVFGYHILQVEERITESTPQPFEKVKDFLKERLTQPRLAEAQKAFITPIRDEVGFKVMEAAKRDAFLLDDEAVAPDEVLAEIGGKKIVESDFQWFLKDALMPQQRVSVYSRPGARLAMLNSFLDMLVLEAKARKEGVDKSPGFIRNRAIMEGNLLSDFMRERDKSLRHPLIF